MKLDIKIFIITFFVSLFFLDLKSIHAAMISENFAITSHAISSGSVEAQSTNYQFYSTLGQSSPIAFDSNYPLSLNYDLYPGFWNTLIGSPKKSARGLPWLILLLED